MDRNQLANLLRETFWETISDDHNPFGWHTPEGERIDGKLPPTLFDRLADAVNDGLRSQTRQDVAS